MNAKRSRGTALALIGVLALALGVGAALLSGGGGGSSPAPRAAVTGSAAAPRLTMPPDRAAARLFLVGFGGTRPDDPGVRRLAGRDWGGVVVERDNAASAAGVRALVAGIRARARRGGRDAPLIALDQTGGPGTALPSLPPAPQPRQRTPAQAAAQAAAAARALRPLGVDLVLAPVADVARAVGPATDSGFSDDPAVTARLVEAAVHAYRLGGMASAPGHFPGQGAASSDPEDGPATVGFDLATLRTSEARPFAAVAREAPAIQMSDAMYAAWDGVTPATLAPEAYDLLRRGIGFGGVAISGDLNAVTAVTGGTVAQAAVDALRAGADLLWIPGDAAEQERAYRAVLDALRRDPRLRARAAASLERVGTLEQRYAGSYR